MSDSIHHSPDLHLADFTDHLLAGEINHVPELASKDLELAHLEKTVARIRNAFPDREPEQGMQTRVRNSLMNEYHKTIGQNNSGAHRSWQTSRLLEFGLAAGGVAVVIGALLLFPSDLNTTPGAATSMPVWVPIALIVIVAGGVIYWFKRKK